MQMVNRHRKRRSASVTIREVRSKATTRYHLILIRAAVIKKGGIINAVKDAGKRKHVDTIGGNTNWHMHYVKQ